MISVLDPPRSATCVRSVGERIETESDRRLLIEAGVMYAQGYLYGRPIIDESFFVRGPRALRSAA